MCLKFQRANNLCKNYIVFVDPLNPFCRRLCIVCDPLILLSNVTVHKGSLTVT